MRSGTTSESVNYKQSEDELREKLEKDLKKGFEMVIETYKMEIHSYLTRLMRNYHDAEDATQETFIKAYTHIERFKWNCRLRTWLYRIATNTAFKALKKSKRYDLTPEVASREISSADNPTSSLIKEEELQLVQDAINNLPPRQKAVLIMRLNQELSFAEIAQALSISEGAAKANHFQAIKSIQRRLKAIYNDRSDQT